MESDFITALYHTLFSEEPVTNHSPFCLVMASETAFVHSAYLLFTLIPLIHETLCLSCASHSLLVHIPQA